MRLAVIPVTPFEQNCSVVWDEETMVGAVVDPGGDLDQILEFVTKQGIKLEKILVTHGHLDHASGVAPLAEQLKIPIEGPQREEVFWIDKLADQARNYGFPPTKAFTPDRWLEQGDKVSVGPISFDVLHCPGHTPGHVVFYQPDNKLAIVGDVLFQGSIGRTDFPRGNHQQLVDAIRNRLFPLGDDVRFVPGHGPMSTFGRERQTNPFVGDSAVG